MVHQENAPVGNVACCRAAWPGERHGRRQTAPPTAEQKARAEMDKAKAAWSDKVAAFQLCNAQDRAVAQYQASGKGTRTQAGAPCADPGPFVPPAPATPATPATPAPKG